MNAAQGDPQAGGAREAQWPGGHKFALFLSHDIDNFYDRELFRLLSDANHLRRVWLGGDRGNANLCVRRILRAALHPRRPGLDIQTILSIERGLGFTSTFFLLEDPKFSSYGGRYRYSDRAVREAAQRIVAAGCELGVHGAYYAFNDASKYRDQRRSFERAIGIKPTGIRNHYLRHSGAVTWRAQSDAGYSYDASFGLTNSVGVREGLFRPFLAFAREKETAPGFVVLPLTIMDSILFRRLGLGFADALGLCKTTALEVERRGGLLSLLWHNDCFGEPEYRDWQAVYEELLAWLAGRWPWNATAEAIADWCRGRC